MHPPRAVTVPRIIVAGATTAITRRTTLRKAFLAPWHPLVTQVWLYSLAEAQRRTGVAVHHAIGVINHHHLTVTPQRDNLPEFTRLFHHDVSSALNTLLAHERYDTPRELFDSRSTHCMRLLDAGAQASQLVYEHNNCVAAGLVSRPEQMPGYAFDFDLWRTGHLDVARPPVYFGRDRPEHLRLYVTPPPLLFAAFGGDLEWLAYHMKRSSNDACRTLREARRRPPLGARHVERLHPWSEPHTLRERGGGRIPTFRIGARGILGKQIAVAAALETREFRKEHAEAHRARRAGEDARFPYGTYWVRVQQQAPVADHPKPGGLVTQPGVLLCDVDAELAACERTHARAMHHEQVVELLDSVRAAIDEEKDDLCAAAELDFEHDASGSAGSTSLVDHAGRGDRVLVRRRFDAPVDNGREHIDRIVVLRDVRRGRPPGGNGRRGNDPPAR